MTLLEFDHVWLRYRRGERGRRERVALREVTLKIASADLVAVLGPRRSGRSTLLDVAAGIMPPTDGRVTFDGDDVARTDVLGAPNGIGYCFRDFDRVVAETVMEHVAAPLLSGDISSARAESLADEMLERVGAGACADCEPDELDHAQTIRVAIARALVSRPRLLLIDEPTVGVSVAEERSLLQLVASISRDDGIAVLMTIDDASGARGVDRVLTIDNGELRGRLVPDEATAPVRHLRSA
jgi:energy-coupling factor transporter ATP-binding protein EcfA2